MKVFKPGSPVPINQTPTLINAALTQNIWYDAWTGIALASAGTGTIKRNLRVNFVTFLQLVADETLEIRIETEKGIETLTQAPSVAGTPYYLRLADVTMDTNIFAISGAAQSAKAFLIDLQWARIEVRKTTAAGANATQFKVIHGLYP